MADDNLDVLLRTTDNTTMSLEQSKKFNNTKRKINGICKALSMNTQKYDPQKTVENISENITSTNKLDRILYSEISNYVYSLEMSERGIFATNLEKLLLYSLDDNTIYFLKDESVFFIFFGFAFVSCLAIINQLLSIENHRFLDKFHHSLITLHDFHLHEFFHYLR